jgi:hypothetical protein
VFESRLAGIAAAVSVGEYRFSEHYIQDNLPNPDRPRQRHVVEALTSNGSRIIEDDPRHHYEPCVLILSEAANRAIHVESTYPPRFVVIITAYWPDTQTDEWTDDTYSRRRR